jgi:hypothetical protein
MDRRTFLGGVLSLSAARVPPSHAGFPRLMGDGVSDDTKALRALFSRGGILVDGQAIELSDGSEVYIRGGTYLITGEVQVRTFYNIIEDATFMIDRTHPREGCLVFCQHTLTNMRRCKITTKSRFTGQDRSRGLTWRLS